MIPRRFGTLDDCFRQTPELFPVNFALGYELKDDRMSAKQQIPIRRISRKTTRLTASARPF